MEIALTKPRNLGQSKGLEERGQLRFWTKISNAPPLGGGCGVVGGMPHKTNVFKKAFRHPKPASPMSQLAASPSSLSPSPPLSNALPTPIWRSVEWMSVELACPAPHLYSPDCKRGIKARQKWPSVTLDLNFPQHSVTRDRPSSFSPAP